MFTHLRVSVATCARPGCGAHRDGRTDGPHLFAELVPTRGVPTEVVFAEVGDDGNGIAYLSSWSGEEHGWVSPLPLPEVADGDLGAAVARARRLVGAAS